MLRFNLRPRELTKGDIFKIPTKIGFGFLQFVEFDDLGIEYIRVLDHISKDGKISQNEVNLRERWCVGFPLKVASRKKIVEKLGNFDLPTDFEISNYARTKHTVRGEFLGWHIVNRNSLMRQLKKELSKEELKLSPHGIMNDTLIIERLEINWKLEDWK